MENPYEYEMKQKRKIVIATVVMVAIILALLVWVIIAAVTRSGDVATDNTQPIVATEEQIPDEANGTTSEANTPHDSNTPTTGTINSSSSSNSNSSSTTNNAVSAISNTSHSTGDLPTTGPADLALTALLAGTASYLAIRYFDSRRALRSLPVEK